MISADVSRFTSIGQCHSGPQPADSCYDSSIPLSGHLLPGQSKQGRPKLDGHRLREWCSDAQRGQWIGHPKAGPTCCQDSQSRSCHAEQLAPGVSTPHGIGCVCSGQLAVKRPEFVSKQWVCDIKLHAFEQGDISVCRCSSQRHEELDFQSYVSVTYTGCSCKAEACEVPQA